MSEIIRLDNVVWMARDNWRAVNGISLCVQEHEWVRICADRSSGDALMRLIAGMEAPNSGSVYVLNQDVQAMSRSEAAAFRNRHIGVVLEEPDFLDKLSVAENVSLPLVVRGMSRQQSKKAAADMLSTLGIQHLAAARAVHLSNLERRTAGLARALITKPQILLLNGVTLRLSERDTQKIIETIHAAVPYGDCTMLWFDGINSALCTHRTIQLEYGKIREDGK